MANPILATPNEGGRWWYCGSAGASERVLADMPLTRSRRPPGFISMVIAGRPGIPLEARFYDRTAACCMWWAAPGSREP